MADMRDALLKAGVISKKQKRRADHAERQEKATQRKQPRKRAASTPEQEPSRRVTSQDERIRELVRSGRVDYSSGARRRFHFIARDGYISFLIVSDAVGYQLERGLTAVVEDLAQVDAPQRNQPTHNTRYEHTVVDRATALEIQKLDDEPVRFFRS